MEAPEVARIEAEREAEVEEIERDYFWGDCKDALAFREGAQICKGATPTTPSPASRASLVSASPACTARRGTS
jgi:hypothetical protein